MTHEMKQLRYPIAAFAAGILMMLFQMHFHPILDRDSFFYWDFLCRWETTAVYPADPTVPPLFLLLVKYLRCFALSIPAAGILVSLICYALSGWVMFLIARELNFSWKLSSGIMALFLLHPMILKIGHSFLRDGLFLFLEISVFFLFLRILHGGKIFLFPCLGCFCGLGILTRFEGLVFFGVAFVSTAVLLTVQKERTKVERMLAFLLFLSATALTIAVLYRIVFQSPHNMFCHMQKYIRHVCSYIR